MKTATMKRAIEEARCFILAASKTKPATYNGQRFEWQESGQHTAATKRASMDLSRTLAELRQNK